MCPTCVCYTPVCLVIRLSVVMEGCSCIGQCMVGVMRCTNLYLTLHLIIACAVQLRTCSGAAAQLVNWPANLRQWSHSDLVLLQGFLLC